MEMLPSLLVLCTGIYRSSTELITKAPVTPSVDILCVLHGTSHWTIRSGADDSERHYTWMSNWVWLEKAHDYNLEQQYCEGIECWYSVMKHSENQSRRVGKAPAQIGRDHPHVIQ